MNFNMLYKLYFGHGESGNPKTLNDLNHEKVYQISYKYNRRKHDK